jgi:biopolymer transport protein ExbB
LQIFNNHIPANMLQQFQLKFTTTLTFLMKGGWIMLPIVVLSLITCYALIERILFLATQGHVSKKWLNNLYSKLLTGEIEEAKLLCEAKNNIIVNVVKAGIDNLPHEPENIEHYMEEASQSELNKLEKNLSLLSAIAGLAPMLGFLGTVTGMIKAFMAMSQVVGNITPQVLANGIYEAMITTAAGLIVGILADVGYKYILTRIDKTSHKIEQIANQVIDIVQELYKIARKG